MLENKVEKEKMILIVWTGESKMIWKKKIKNYLLRYKIYPSIHHRWKYELYLFSPKGIY